MGGELVCEIEDASMFVDVIMFDFIMELVILLYRFSVKYSSCSFFGLRVAFWE